jgi:YaiO family outer membrane protein
MKNRAPVALAILALIPLSSALRAGEVLTTGKANKTEIPAETSPEERFRHWTIVPFYSYSFFNKGRQAWQEEDLQIYYQVNRQLSLGAEIDILQRPPSGTNIYYSGMVSYYPWKWLELHAKLSFSPNPSFAAKQIYSGGFQYQVMPRIGLLLDYQHFNFVQGPIDQINPGLAIAFTDDITLTLRYVRGWAFYDLEYNYYSAALNIGLPGKRRLTLGFAYGTDPDSEAGSNNGQITSLSPAYTYSVFFTQPVTRDLNVFAGVQYVYRLNQSGGELYQQLTPTIGLTWKF